MDIKMLLMPILSFIAALVALFTDTKDLKTKKILISVLLLALLSICAIEINSNYESKSEKYKLNDEIQWGNERIKNLSQALLNFENTTGENFDQLFALLEQETEKFTKEVPTSILTIATKRNWYIDIGIAWALQSFISTLALSKYLEGRSFEE